MKHASAPAAKAAFAFVLTMGIVNLFADMTYEGGGSINGPFLATLGANAALISTVAGLGELLGYSLRLVAGYVSDRTGKHWLITFIGYSVNLLAVPAMAVAGGLPSACALILLERIGRALRKPTVESMLSYTTGTLGHGWVYALNTALDETGATIGPLLIAGILLAGGGYRSAYAVLVGSTVLALAALTAARLVFPLPARFGEGQTPTTRAFSRPYWLSMGAAALFATGMASFELIAFHLATRQIVSGPWVPAVLALATVVGIAASLLLGRLYDRVGMPAVLLGVLLSCGFAPLVFLGGSSAALAGMLLWGVGYATQDTLFKALIAGMLPEGRRNLAFGLFYATYGVGWLTGSTVMGLLYERSLAAMAGFAMVMQLAALPVFLIAWRAPSRHASREAH